MHRTQAHVMRHYSFIKEIKEGETGETIKFTTEVSLPVCRHEPISHHPAPLGPMPARLVVLVLLLRLLPYHTICCMPSNRARVC